MEELTIEKAFETLKVLVLKGVPQQGSFEEIEQKRQAIDQILLTVENALNLKQKENGE